MKRSLKGDGTRRTTSPINVWCLPAERAEIEANAKTAGLSLSAYLREVALGTQPRNVVDYQQVDVLARTHADINRLGGLLKMWLTNEERGGHREVSELLGQIAEASRALTDTAKKILRSP
ncbi:conjugal transfer protein TraJ [Azospirillum formosense]|uniref:plasmid mobilization protein n=1 Tax=Azospirillum formosense TaxID=861533 RepID=UPI00338D75DA